MSRTIYHLVHKNADDRWHLEEGGRITQSFDAKQQALEEGKRICNGLWESGTRAQLVVHRLDGSIETEYTYGADPRRMPG